MESFLNKKLEGNRFELLIDTKIFSKDIVLKTAYNFLDLGYFLFSLNGDNIIMQFTNKDSNKKSLNDIVSDFSSGLLETYLRFKLEKDNKTIREAIVEKAINGPLDTANFVSLDTDSIKNNSEQNQVDFNKDIDDILAEIENDPELKIDEQEIENILKEIEEETESVKPSININKDALKKAKQNFKK